VVTGRSLTRPHNFENGWMRMQPWSVAGRVLLVDRGGRLEAQLTRLVILEVVETIKEGKTVYEAN
jgi:hypothetical protein